jgi:hypothetical protein
MTVHLLDYVVIITVNDADTVALVGDCEFPPVGTESQGKNGIFYRNFHFICQFSSSKRVLECTSLFLGADDDLISEAGDAARFETKLRC